MLSATNAQREAIILQRRRDHVSFTVIGEELGVSMQRVHQIFQKAMARVPQQQINDLRREGSELADRAISDLLSIAENPRVSPRTRCEAWACIRSWAESLRKLHGVDAPVRREITVVSAETVDNAIAELTRDMAAMDAEAKAIGVDLGSS